MLQGEGSPSSPRSPRRLWLKSGIGRNSWAWSEHETIQPASQILHRQALNRQTINRLNMNFKEISISLQISIVEWQTLKM